MENKKLGKNIIVAGFIVAFVIAAYYSYLKVEYARNNGVYTIAYVKKIRPAKNGWKVKTELNYDNKLFQFEHLDFWETFSFKQNERRLFAKILIKNNEVKLGFTYNKMDVPDSIQSAPPEGWNEAWMKEHYPQVVGYVHDTR